jgi:predicted nucleotidyltransferase
MKVILTTKEEIAVVVARYAAGQPDVLAGYLFGSAVRERLTPESDIDIALLFSQPPEALRLVDMQEDLTTLLGRQAHLVNLKQASAVLGMQVLRSGEIVFERSPRATREFQVGTMFAYFDLKRVRKPIEEALLSR